MITINNTSDTKPRIRDIGPDEALKPFAMLPAGIVPDMTLLHYEDVHFDLIVSKKSRIFMEAMKKLPGSAGESEDELKNAANPPKKARDTSDVTELNHFRK